MARTAITANEMDPGFTALPDPDDIDATNGMVLDAPLDRPIMLIVLNSTAASKAVTVKAGANPPASVAGDEAQTIAQDASYVFWLRDTARFAQADGKINVDFATSMTGSITAIIGPVGI